MNRHVIRARSVRAEMVLSCSTGAFDGCAAGADVYVDRATGEVGRVGALEHPRIGAFVHAVAPNLVVVDIDPSETVFGANGKMVINVTGPTTRDIRFADAAPKDARALPPRKDTP